MRIFAAMVTGLISHYSGTALVQLWAFSDQNLLLILLLRKKGAGEGGGGWGLGGEK